MMLRQIQVFSANGRLINWRIKAARTENESYKIHICLSVLTYRPFWFKVLKLKYCVSLLKLLIEIIFERLLRRNRAPNFSTSKIRPKLSTSVTKKILLGTHSTKLLYTYPHSY